MQQLKIRKDLWELILKGEKTSEFRKLSKGLESGTYEFVSIETVAEANDEFEACDNCLNCAGNEICWKGYLPNEVFGTAKLIPLDINPYVYPNTLCNNDECNNVDGICYCEKQNFVTTEHRWFEKALVENNDEISDERPLDAFEWLIGHKIDKETYDFVKENYIDKGIDFIAWELSEVKNETN